MPKRKRVFLRRWHCEGLGNCSIDMDLMATEEQVVEALDRKYGRGNWFRDTLTKGEKIKAR